MNEQTAIELLKLSNELMNFSTTKFSAYLVNQIPKSDEKPIPTDCTAAIFQECVKTVHEQYALLIKK